MEQSMEQSMEYPVQRSVGHRMEYSRERPLKHTMKYSMEESMTTIQGIPYSIAPRKYVLLRPGSSLGPSCRLPALHCVHTRTQTGFVGGNEAFL